MSGLQRYDHARMVEHATQQANLVGHLQGLQQDANNQIASIAEIWTQHGSNAAQQCHAQISLAFTQVFDTINRHGTAIFRRLAACRDDRFRCRGRLPEYLTMTVGVGARLSTTSEGLWLTAALAGITRMPGVLKLRPVGGVEGINAHPGMAVLEASGVCHEGVLDPDVADWVMTLGRPDIEVDVSITVAAERGDRMAGPPPVFVAPDDPVEAHTALIEWQAQQPPQRRAALCRRDGWWASAARMWQVGGNNDSDDAGEHDSDDAGEDFDEIVVCPLGQTASIASAVSDLLGPGTPAQFQGVSIEADVLDSIVTHWQSNPDSNVVAMLAEAGMTPEQARIVEVVGDATTARATISALEHHVEGAVLGDRAMMVADTLLGRVLVSATSGPDGQVWTMLTAGTEQRIAAALGELLESLPSGADWPTHQRIRK